MPTVEQCFEARIEVNHSATIVAESSTRILAPTVRLNRTARPTHNGRRMVRMNTTCHRGPCSGPVCE